MSPSLTRRSAAVAVVAAVVAAAVLAGVSIAAPATPLATDGSQPHDDSLAQPPNTTSYLHVSENHLEQSTYTSVGVDVPGTTAISHDRLRIRLVMDRFEQAFDDASTATNRTATIRNATRALENTTERLRERQSRAIERYNRGTIDEQSLFRTLTRVDAAAQTVANETDLLRDIDERALGYVLSEALDTRLENLEADLASVRGRTVRQRVVRNAVYGGSMAGTHVYLETGADTFALATILENNYVREAYAGGAFDPNNTVDPQESTSRINDLYRWALQPGNLVSVGSEGIGNRIGNTSVQEVSINHVQGSFTAYFDGNTSNVYQESQSKRLADAEPRTVLNATNGSLSLSVVATHDTGPMLVSLTDNATGDPRDGTVYVDDRSLGSLGEDGQRWVVDTRAATTVRVVADDGSVSILVPTQN
ncbi:hypothetical protein GJ629_13200 [Halapricum sp. CBA1109]|uniref:DUF7096 domain-containing protein n=1 Tax=Halapricum sp. CBA1109 TaxID=2668068 RepID=UPI0012FAA21E|nr:hypothetical protein [Halapricum sp. CBA1109]MUV90739.1 hypothetical protein [Halapricum sp. CBA1109]